MDLYLIVLRIIHVLSGVFWAGGAFVLTGFVAPAAGLAGPEGGKFMQQLVLGTRWVRTVAIAAGLTVLAGALLYWRKFNGPGLDWVLTGEGIGFTVGGIAGIIAFVAGVRVGSTSIELAELGQRIGAAGGPPSPEQAAELTALQERLQGLGTLTAILLVVAILSMSTAQYIFF